MDDIARFPVHEIGPEMAVGPSNFTFPNESNEALLTNEPDEFCTCNAMNPCSEYKHPLTDEPAWRLTDAPDPAVVPLTTVTAALETMPLMVERAPGIVMPPALANDQAILQGVVGVLRYGAAAWMHPHRQRPTRSLQCF